MFEKLLNCLSGIPLTLLSGGFLLLDLLPWLASLMGWTLPDALGLPFSPAWGAVLISGLPLLVLALKRLVCNRGLARISSALLISVAMIAAIVIGDLFAAGEVAFIMAIGAILEDKTVERAKKGLHTLLALAPNQARRVIDGVATQIRADAVCVGDVLRVLPGELIPVDGIVISGETSVNQAVMTGESLPVEKKPGDTVFCGTLNCFGAIDLRATSVGTETSLQKLIRLVENAKAHQAPMQRIADRWASLLVPMALSIAVISGVITGEITVAVTILVVFCPCALVLATPTAIMAAIGQAARKGVIIKSGVALETMGKVRIVAFDKTGTLTFGTPMVSDVLSVSDDYAPKRLLTLVAATESMSEHPLGKAILAHARQQNLTLPEVTSFKMSAGRGICATVDGHTVQCGSEAYLHTAGVVIPERIVQLLTDLRSEGKATILAVIDSVCTGIVALADTLRPETPTVIESLHNLGLRSVLLTGDHVSAANTIAQQARIDTVRAALLPEEKVTAISDFQAHGERLCMVGDGVNDAPALKRADVGLAMGVNGTAIAVDAADIVLMRDDLRLLPYLKRLADATAWTIRLSISLSLLINFIAICLSLLQWLTPTTGALVHNAGSCLVVLIATLLYDRKFD